SYIMKLFIIIVAISFSLTACNSQTKKEEVKDSSESESIKITDEALMDSVQKQTFNYFWDGAEPNSGMAPERIHMDNIYPSDDKHIVTTGGTGFGLMAILVGIERGFI